LGRLFSLSASSPLRDGPPRGEPLVASPAQQEGSGGQRLVERELGKLRAISDQADPAAGPEAFVVGRVVDDAFRWSSGNQTLAARPASPPCLKEQPVSFAGPPGVILAGSHEVFVDGHGLLLFLIGVVSYRRRRRGWRAVDERAADQPGGSGGR